MVRMVTRRGSLEARAQSLDRSLICPVCPGETIDQSQATLANQMQAFVREKLRTGWTDRQIRQYFVDRYGDGVLAAPPKTGFNLIVWVVPPVGVLGGLLLLVLAVRAMRWRPEAGEAPEAEGVAGLEPYLALVDREIESDLIPYCQEHEITIIAYSPLAQGFSNITSRDRDSVIRSIALEIGHTEAQVALSWVVAHTPVIAIPKTSTVSHIEENCAVSGWRLSPENMDHLNNAFSS